MTEYELLNAEEEFKSERKYFHALRKDRDTFLCRKLALALCFFSIFSIPNLAESLEMLCPHCDRPIEIFISTIPIEEGGIFQNIFNGDQD